MLAKSFKHKVVGRMATRLFLTSEIGNFFNPKAYPPIILLVNLGFKVTH